MNCKDDVDLEEEIFINHGWKSFRIYEKLSPKKTYQTYVKMQEAEDKMWKEDVMVLFENNIAARFEAILMSTERLLGFCNS